MRDFLYGPGSEPTCTEAGAETCVAMAAAVPSLHHQFWEAKSTSQLFPLVQSCLLKKNTLVPFTLNTARTTTTRNIAYSRFLSLPFQAELWLQEISVSAHAAGLPSTALPLRHTQGAGGSLPGTEHTGGRGLRRVGDGVSLTTMQGCHEWQLGLLEYCF